MEGLELGELILADSVTFPVGKSDVEGVERRFFRQSGESLSAF